MNFNFGEVLTRAWQIIWKHKVLWIFGILASCGRGSGGGNGGGGRRRHLGDSKLPRASDTGNGCAVCASCECQQNFAASPYRSGVAAAARC